MNLRAFVEHLRQNRKSILIIIACSGGKRCDSECAEVARSLNFPIAEKGIMELFPSISQPISDFRSCTRRHHFDAVQRSSKLYPSFVRYSGKFYKSITTTQMDLWRDVAKENWNVLILSGYYGFLTIQEKIQNYKFSITKLRAECRRKLVRILQSYLVANPHLTQTYFFTSRTYTKPFSGIETDAFRLSLTDIQGEEILGPYGGDFYSAAGRIFSSLISGDIYKDITRINVSLHRLNKSEERIRSPKQTHEVKRIPPLSNDNVHYGGKTLNRGSEVTRERIKDWTRAFRGFKPLSNEAMKTYIQSHADLLKAFTDFINFFDKKVENLLSQGTRKKEAKKTVVEYIRKRQSEIGLKPNCNLAKLSGVTQYLRTYSNIPTLHPLSDPSRADQIEALLLEPKKPFSNLLQLYSFLEKLGEEVDILDKHFGRQGFSHLQNFNPLRTKTLRLLLGKSQYNESFVRFARAYSQEMRSYRTEAEFRLLDPADEQDIHDRYLICEKMVYSTPPWNIIHKKLGTILAVNQSKEADAIRRLFRRYWGRASKIS